MQWRMMMRMKKKGESDELMIEMASGGPLLMIAVTSSVISAEIRDSEL